MLLTMRNQFGQYEKGNVNQHVGKTNCVNGHKFTEENTRTYTRQDGAIERVCRECVRLGMKRYYAKDPARVVAERERQRIKERRVHDKVIELLGNKCCYCGVTEHVFLTVDHINNDGAAHRKNARHMLYREILKDPDALGKYQCMCMNCNWAKRVLGICPHQKKLEVVA